MRCILYYWRWAAGTTRWIVNHFCCLEASCKHLGKKLILLTVKMRDRKKSSSWWQLIWLDQVFPQNGNVWLKLLEQKILSFVCLIWFVLCILLLSGGCILTIHWEKTVDPNWRTLSREEVLSVFHLFVRSPAYKLLT